MNLYELFQKESEENAENVRKCIEFIDLRLKFLDDMQEKLAVSDKMYGKGEITAKEQAKMKNDCLAAAVPEFKKLEESHKQSSVYAQMLVRLKDRGFEVSNETLCTLLQKTTNENWSCSVVMTSEREQQILHLVFENNNLQNPQKICAEKAKVTDGDCNEIVRYLEDINWFEVYMSASAQKKMDSEDKLEFTLMNGERKELPKLIQNSLEEYFKSFQVPADLCPAPKEEGQSK